MKTNNEEQTHSVNNPWDVIMKGDVWIIDLPIDSYRIKFYVCSCTPSKNKYCIFRYDLGDSQIVEKEWILGRAVLVKRVGMHPIRGVVAQLGLDISMPIKAEDRGGNIAYLKERRSDREAGKVGYYWSTNPSVEYSSKSQAIYNAFMSGCALSNDTEQHQIKRGKVLSKIKVPTVPNNGRVYQGRVSYAGGVTEFKINCTCLDEGKFKVTGRTKDAEFIVVPDGTCNTCVLIEQLTQLNEKPVTLTKNSNEDNQQGSEEHE